MIFSEEIRIWGEIFKMKDENYDNYKFQSQFRTKSGELIPVAVYFSKMKDKAGELIGFVLVGHDLRETYLLQSTLRELSRERNELKIRNSSMEKELEMARNIQLKLIPNTKPVPGIAYFYKPMQRVGGDFLDFIEFKNKDIFGIFISDVSGHGVPAAFITMMIKSSLQQSAPYVNNPAYILYYLNDLLYKQTNGNFITAFYGIFNPATREFIYSNAGHNKPFLINNGEGTMLSMDSGGFPLGVDDNEGLKSRKKKICQSYRHPGT